jgi:hypothetical protein
MSLAKIKQNSSDMNEIILAPCDVISKIKQNSSDMNEIILASCDAGYVQSCTGYINTCLYVSHYMQQPLALHKGCFSSVFPKPRPSLQVSFSSSSS